MAQLQILTPFSQLFIDTKQSLDNYNNNFINEFFEQQRGEDNERAYQRAQQYFNQYEQNAKYINHMLNNENQILRSQIVISKSENADLKSQNATSSSQNWGGTRKLPYAFTEQGVAMLASVLKSETAVKVSIQIMNAFVQMRHFLAANGSLFARLDSVEKQQIETEEKLNRNIVQIQEKLTVHEKNFEKVFDALEAADLPKQGVFCNGQIFDSYKFVSDLIRKAKTSIVLVDNYVDDTVLSMLDKRKPGVSATIYTQSISKQLTLDLQKHNAQYAPIDLRVMTNFHDRFLFIDEKFQARIRIVFFTILIHKIERFIVLSM